MKINFTNKSPKKGAVCVAIFDDNKFSDAANALDSDSGGSIRKALETSRFSGKAGQVIQILAPMGVDADRIIVAGVGKQDNDMALAWESYGAAVIKELLTSGLETITFSVGDLEGIYSARIAFGALLAAYRFDNHRTKLSADKKPSVDFVCIDGSQKKTGEVEFSSLNELAEGVYLARDLVSEPGNIINPESFAKCIQGLSDTGLEIEVLDEKDMRKLGMDSLLSVGAGSNYGSKLAIMKWMGGKAGDAPVVLVGKGVTFDSGGISLKPGNGMWDMKGDMGGAAAVTGAMRAIAGRKAKANVIGIVGLVENMPDAAATRPGDIIKSADGQTIEVQNTDAEGRLVLVDAIWYGITSFKPCRIIDLATLTGAILVALGQENAGLFSNDDRLASDLTVAGKISGEEVWRLPLGSGYDKLIDTPNADMKNIGGPFAGSITAAQFLKRFVGDVPWAHIDIAGTAWKDKRADPRESVWATGFGVRLLDRFIAESHES
ncbi:leucyl aminopeptidase [Oceanicaulis sp. AH-315-P02]|nr:leucyl aminopeptidase [Robiginitomaculum sp.]MBN4047915.1 leucyl aminopeptidase [Oceanicaulis sp. AH-315-P02]